MKTRMQAHAAREEDARRLTAIAQGAVELTGKDFSFRGERYRPGQAKKLLEQVQMEIDQDFQWMAGLDRDALLIHHGMARRLGEECHRDLEVRYRFHIALQQIVNALSNHKQRVLGTLNFLGDNRQLSKDQFQNVVRVFLEAHDALRQSLEMAGNLHIPALRNLKPGTQLTTFLLPGPLLTKLDASSKSLDGKWIGAFLEQLTAVLDKARRLHFKSLGGILALQEKLSEQWTARTSGEGEETRGERQE